MKGEKHGHRTHWHCLFIVGRRIFIVLSSSSGSDHTITIKISIIKTFISTTKLTLAFVDAKRNSSGRLGARSMSR